jgi:hypothetical protein
VACVLGPVPVLPGRPHCLPGRGPPAVCPPAVLPALPAVLAVEHRQGVLDGLHARCQRLRRRPGPDLPAPRLAAPRHRSAPGCC